MQPDILILMCDTARADAFGPWGGPHPTPAISRMAAEGFVYDNAITPAPWTLPAHASLFTGRLPTEHGITGECLGWTPAGPSAPSAAVGAYTGPWLTESMRDRGYRTVGVTCNPWVGSWGGFDRGFDSFADVRRRVGRRTSGFRKVVGRARQMASGNDHGGEASVRAFGSALVDAGDRPVFGFANLMEVHSPYDPPRRFHPALDRGPSRQGWTGKPHILYYQYRQMGRFRTRTDRRYVSAMRALYYATARYEDIVVGGFLDAVRRRGRPAVVALVADHGENLGDHGLFGHHSSLAETLLRVPMLIWSQGVGLGEGRVSEPVSAHRLAGWVTAVADGMAAPLEPDAHPVVAEYESARNQFGEALPFEVADGPRRAPGAVPQLVAEPGVAIRSGNQKFVAVQSGAQHLFDLSADPDEEHDVLAWKPEAAEPFRPMLEEWRARRGAQRTFDVGETADEEIAVHLRDLGYIE
jgi:arylsulfatase A-like enzyme